LTEAEVKAAGIAEVVVVAADRFIPFVRTDRKGPWHGIRTVQNRPSLLGYRGFENLLYKLRSDAVDGEKSGFGWGGDELAVLFPGCPIIRHLGPAARGWR
jgi:hypothetical protein